MTMAIVGFIAFGVACFFVGMNFGPMPGSVDERSLLSLNSTQNSTNNSAVNQTGNAHVSDNSAVNNLISLNSTQNPTNNSRVNQINQKAEGTSTEKHSGNKTLSDASDKKATKTTKSLENTLNNLTVNNKSNNK